MFDPNQPDPSQVPLAIPGAPAEEVEVEPGLPAEVVPTTPLDGGYQAPDPGIIRDQDS